MTAEIAFSLLNLATMPWWLSMILFPSSRTTVRMTTAHWPFMVLGGAYLLALVTGVVAGIASGGGTFGIDAATLAEATSRPWGFVTAWAHMITLDLFAGIWIYRDAKVYGKLPRLSLVATWWAGPLGLAIYLVRRRGWERSYLRTVN